MNVTLPSRSSFISDDLCNAFALWMATDGANAATLLRAAGVLVTKHSDKGTHGLAEGVTVDGKTVALSTNGYITIR